MGKKTRKGEATSVSRQVFLCHSHQDKPFVRKLARDLSELGVQVWYDDWELRPGDSLHDCIGTALETSAYVGVVISPNSVKSNWCKSELSQSLAKEKRVGRTVVLPLVYRRAKIPPFLEDRLHLNFGRSYLRELTKLAALVHRLDMRDISEAISQEKITTVDDVKDALERSGWKGISYLSAEDYDELKALLRKAGMKVGDEIDILPVNKDAPGRKKRSGLRNKPIRRRLKR